MLPRWGGYGAVGRHGHGVGDGVVFSMFKLKAGGSSALTRLAILFYLSTYFNHNFKTQNIARYQKPESRLLIALKLVEKTTLVVV